MLQPPHTRYQRLFVYHLDRRDIPPIDDPDLIGVWIEDEAAILFFHRAKEELLDRFCQQNNIQVTYQADLDYRDWEAGVEIGQFTTRRLHVRPVWEQAPDSAHDRCQIVLDPSVIFGSGFHATTRLCLLTLEDLLEQGPEIDTILDLGTGTGLLAIGAAKLGHGTVRAVDNNPLSCKVAAHNVALNGCDNRVQILEHDLTQTIPDTRCKLVIANLYKSLLIHLFSQDSFWQARYYIISGFIPAMEADLLAALPNRGLRVRDRRARDNWRLWVLENPDSCSACRAG